MKRYFAIFFVTLLPVATLAQDITTTIQKEAQKCAKTVLTDDYEGIVSYTYKRVVKGMGGKAAMIAKLKKGNEERRLQGASFEDATVGQPEKPKKIGRFLVSLIPQHVVMKVPGGHLAQDSHLLGISENSGKNWVFIDVISLSQSSFEHLFPEFEGKIVIPEKKQPVFYE